MIRRLTKNRRGVVILVVLSLLVLFVLLVVTFAIVAGQYERAAKSYSEQDRHTDNPERLMHQAFLQLFRDTNNQNSALRFHSLLRDMNGGDGFIAFAGGAARLQQTGDQFLEITIDTTTAARLPIVSTDGQTIHNNANLQFLPKTDGFYAGCVLTFTSGPAKNASVRIVDYDFDSATSLYKLRTMAFRREHNSTINPNDLVGHRFVVNGRPFNGTGVGYRGGRRDPLQPATSKAFLNDWDGNFPNNGQFKAWLALLPNYSVTTPNATGWTAAKIEALDESHDVPDYQNMFMGMVLPGAGRARHILPSFHRPALINFWDQFPYPAPPTTGNNFQLTGNLWNDGTILGQGLRRRAVLRPLPQDHPNFTGSNLAFALEAGTRDWNQDGTPDPDANQDGLADAWDVDNDGDGIADSIWLDLGLPVITTEDGRRYKPLFAILCTDLDGRLNVNAHGTVVAGNGRGSGYGPAEVDLRSFIGAGDYVQLLRERYANNNPGRPNLDTMTAVRMFEYPSHFFNNNTRTSFRSPPDLHGELTVQLNATGQGQYSASTRPDARADSPYEADLSNNRPGGDSPFSAADLERVLRANDLDSQVRNLRLGKYSVFGTAANRRLVTTDSFDLPVPNIMAPGDIAKFIRDNGINSPSNRAFHVTDLLRARIIQASSWTVQLPPQQPLTPQQETLVNAVIRQRLLPQEVILGQRLDINRPLGNGRDDNQNGVVDEPQEVVTVERLWTTIASPSYTNNIQVNHTNGTDVNGDGTVNAIDQLLARQLLARHLYVLGMALTQRPTNAQARDDRAKEIAQWAINVVDYRDADAIMTPFEYDVEPFDIDPTGTPPKYGWDVDGIVDGYLGMSPQNSDDQFPHRRLVWGGERPELLISESFAFHARRTQDTKADHTGHDTTERQDPNNPNSPRLDDDFDQRFLPKPGTFIELYNPWTGTDTQYAPPSEFYRNPNGNLVINNGGNLPLGVKLNITTPNGHPVWRILIANSRDNANLRTEINPDLDPNPGANPGSRPTIERSVYFTSPAALPAGSRDGNRRYWTTLPVAPIVRGQYAVIGSKGTIDANGDRVTPVGNLDPNAANNAVLEQTRRIAITPNANPVVNQVKVFQGGNLPAEIPPNPAVGIALNQSDLQDATRLPLDFAVSEPLNGYPNYTNASPGPNGEIYDPGTGEYMPPLGTPLDKRMGGANGKYRAEVAETNGTTPTFCRVYLQRLADPLQNWNRNGNPYRTIDTMTLDLTAFNGLKRHSGNSSDPDIQNNGTINFRCLERGAADPNAASGRNRRLWRFEPPRGLPANNTRVEANRIHYFPYDVIHSFGRVNNAYTNAANVRFPWLNWPNRPFISQYELMSVPNRNNFDMLKDFDLLGTRSVNPYDESHGSYASQFEHLTNFFAHDDGNTPDRSLHKYRVLEYVHAPSRFAGTETMLNPTMFTAGVGTEWFHPPFNRISEYRDPGKINLNTLYHGNIHIPMMNGFSGQSFGQLVNSRRGFSSPNNGILPLPQPVAPPPGGSPPPQPVYMPTFFANPYRAPGHGGMVPDLETVATLNTTLERHDIETTILRSTRQNQGDAAGPPDANSVPLFQGTTTAIGNDSRRNPYFRYQNLQRLGNIATTRSNVYAVWITVGFFEVEPNPTGVDEAHPDGFRLGQEVGLDTGAVRRHRAFYIVDRSIPVCFEPGQDRNVEQAILVQRFIE